MLILLCVVLWSENFSRKRKYIHIFFIFKTITSPVHDNIKTKLMYIFLFTLYTPKIDDKGGCCCFCSVCNSVIPYFSNLRFRLGGKDLLFCGVFLSLGLCDSGQKEMLLFLCFTRTKKKLSLCFYYYFPIFFHHISLNEVAKTAKCQKSCSIVFCCIYSPILILRLSISGYYISGLYKWKSRFKTGP